MFLERFQAHGLKPGALATCYAMAENVFAVTQGGIDQPVSTDTIDANAFTTRQVAEPVPPSHPQALPMLSAGSPITGTRIRVLDAQLCFQLLRSENPGSRLGRAGLKQLACCDQLL